MGSASNLGMGRGTPGCPPKPRSEACEPDDRPTRPPVQLSVGAEVPPLGPGAARALLAVLLAADQSWQDASTRRDDRANEHERSA